MEKYPEIFEINLQELNNINIAFFSSLPNLMKLSIRFSYISLISEKEFLSQNRYISLQELNLNCNNLDSSCFEIFRHIKTLRSLNLMGNFITPDIPDISELEYLEDLDLSYNHIESYFINLDMLKDLKINKESGLLDNLDEGNFNYNDKEINEKHMDNTQKTYQKLQNYLKTNMQEFYHRISQLKRLRNLNLSHNKIHFFDTNPLFIQENNGFPELRRLNMSDNLIEEEIAIILVVGIPHLEYFNITNNPITRNKEKLNNIEFEIFKSKNILLTNNEEYKKLKSRYNVNDILNYPPQPYIVKKFKLEQKSKKDLITYVKPELSEDESGDSKEEVEEEDKKDNELPPIGQLSVNPILMTKLDMIGRKKKGPNKPGQKDVFYKNKLI